MKISRNQSRHAFSRALFTAQATPFMEIVGTGLGDGQGKGGVVLGSTFVSSAERERLWKGPGAGKPKAIG